MGTIFSDSRRIQIVWNTANAVFHDELVNLNITRMDDFNGDYETCKTKFILAEQHYQTRRAKTKADSDKKTGKVHKEGGKKADTKKDQNKSSGGSGPPLCNYCGGAHWQINCFKDPEGPNYKGGAGKSAKGNDSNTRGNSHNRNNKRGNEMLNYEEWQDDDAKKARYRQYLEGNSFEEE